MTSKIVGGIIRTLLAAIGGAGFFSDGDLEQLAGAVAVIVTLGWSAWQKYQGDRSDR